MTGREICFITTLLFDSLNHRNIIHVVVFFLYLNCVLACFLCRVSFQDRHVAMSEDKEDTSQPVGLYQCPHCLQDCGNARQLFKHVESVQGNGRPTCLEALHMQSEEFRNEFRSRRRKRPQKEKKIQVILNRFICVKYVF